MTTVLVTGSAGFIGSHVCEALLIKGCKVVGFDCMSDYYDIALKEARESRLLAFDNYRSVHDRLESPQILMHIFDEVLMHILEVLIRMHMLHVLLLLLLATRVIAPSF